MPSPRHTFDIQLRGLEQRVLRLGSFVEGMLDDAVQALVEQDITLAEEVIRRDDVADELDIDIDRGSMRLLALQQPMSRDLRVITTALKITTDLERIGDYAVDIARSALRLAGGPFARPLVRIPRMAEVAARMVRGSLEAFVSRGIEKVEEVVILDDAVDELYRQIWRAILDEMALGVMPDEQGVRLILVARYLERIADHATNVAERVYYMETGVLRQLAGVESPT